MSNYDKQHGAPAAETPEPEQQEQTISLEELESIDGAGIRGAVLGAVDVVGRRWFGRYW